ncbi:RAMP superfamily CRISPR-associated protein [Nocardiopsis mangrovi]|uniref:RAMP superfamily CRISPR-associated protein n=1 Tax=Nocardiopsis mangrovi TaxID=1179818 RepID=A0ABV9DWS4_9ACTN
MLWDTGLDEFAAAAAPCPQIVWEFTARLCLLGDTHIGAAHSAPRHTAGNDVDLIDRDPTDGRPRLRATTQAGLLRHHLAARLGGAGRGAAAELFGEAAPPRGDDDALAAVQLTRSALDLDDAFADLPPEAGVAVRAGNRVDPGSGAAVPGALWQMETLPAGTRFTLTLRLCVDDPESEGRLLALTALAAEGLSGDGPGISLGARTARGYGAARADLWHARRHDLRTAQGWAAWYAPTWAERWERARDAVAGTAATPAEEDGASLLSLLAARLRDTPDPAAVVADAFHDTLAAHGDDRRHRDELTLTLELAERPTAAFLPAPEDPGHPAANGGAAVPRPGLLMVGDTPAPDSIGEVDRTHLRRPRVTGDGGVEWRPTLGDTALFALFKRVSQRLIRDISGEADRGLGEWPEHSPGRRLHTRWWGGESRGGRAPASSRIRLREAAELTGGTSQRTARVNIDALFGDAVDTRFFADDVYAGGRAHVTLDISRPDDAVRGLIALIVRELRTVPLDTIGGGSGIGNGRLTVTGAVLTRHDPGAPPQPCDLVAAIDDARGPERAAVTPWLAALRAAVTPRTAGRPGRVIR